jgi:predicted permease
MFLVILAGWLARKRKALSAETTATLSRFVVDITFPALGFLQMLKSVDIPALRENWFTPLLGVAILLVGQLVGLSTAGFFCRKAQRATFIFLIVINNWVYLPLPIAQGLYGDDGVRVILFSNIGVQLFLWTVGVWTLRGGKPDRNTLLDLLKNPGLLGILAGIFAACVFPSLHLLAGSAANAPAGHSTLAIKAVLQALDFIGGLTIPLSLIVTGAQLGGLELSKRTEWRPLTGVLLGRLFLTPLLVVLLVQLAQAGGITIPEIPRMLGYIVALMPVALSCSIFTERFGGDTALAARGIFYSTLLSIVTVPVAFFFIQKLGW